MKLVTAVLAAATLGGVHVAFAADLPRRTDAIAPAPAFTPPPVFTWTGFYAGLNTGYSFGKFTEGGDAFFGKANGGMIGGTLGYNHQIGSMVLGLEGDWDWTGAKGERALDRKSTRLNSSHIPLSRMPSSA